MENIKAIIYDLDGVLVQGMVEGHLIALNKALGVFGFHIDEEIHNKLYNGLPTKKKLEALYDGGIISKSLIPIISKLKAKYTDEYVEGKLRPSHQKQIMLNSLKDKGYKLACCSNAKKYSVEMMLKKTDLYNYFDLTMGNDEGFEPKPAPDIYLEAFKRLGVEPNEAVIIEDSPHGRQSAWASGSNVIEVEGYEDVNSSLFINNNLL